MNPTLIFWVWRVLLWAGVVASILSAYMHLRYTPWKQSSMGRQLAIYLPSLAIVFFMTAVNASMRGHLPMWVAWTEMAVFFILVVSMFWRLILQWVWRPKKTQKEATNDEGVVLPGS